MNVAAVSSG